MLPSRPLLASNDRNEIHDPTIPTTQQRQQATETPPNSDPDERPYSATPSQQRSLRRTPRFQATPSPEPRRVHLEAASVGFSPRPTPSVSPASASPSAADQRELVAPRAPTSQHKPGNRRPRVQSQHLTQDPDEESSELPDAQHPYQSSRRLNPPLSRTEPHAAVRVSKHTHSAILFALEEALRQPNPFTPDLAEESADMADLMGGGGPSAVSNGNSSHASRRPTAGPAPTSSPIRGPRMIMQERAAREARQRAEAEQQQQLERSRAEQEARVMEESRRRIADRRSAGVAATQGSGLDTQVQIDPQTQGQSHLGSSQPQRNPASTSQPPQSSRHRPTHSQQQQVPPQSYSAQPQAAAPQPAPPQQPVSGAPGPEPSLRDSGSTKPRNSFPHAFERWETLSAHWEGLTSYWIRKLEQNKDDINRDPVSQQLARQVTDLSAAGANLFHAVVELQRLRASSERKFQRWFFETRSELERSQEVNAMLERALAQERTDRADAIREAVDHERGNSKAQQQLSEMRKELAISKEEARRAWEELGRRENQERERTLSLQSGQPTIVGGVQVVPMTQGAPSRHASARDPQQDYAQQGGYAPEQSQAPPVQPQTPPTTTGAAPETYYRTQEPPRHDSPRRGARGASDDGYSEGEYMMDAQGNYILDVHGRKIPFTAAPSTYSGSDAGPEDYDTPATTNPPSGSHEPPSTSAAGSGAQWTGAYSDPQDYSGQGYAAPGWETVPRHHHPTRLSDVIEEEDERSRASTSHVSRG